jgi:hypothetical protein
MSEFAGYDAWKLATPPDPDEEAGLRDCGQCCTVVPVECLDDGGICPACVQANETCAKCGTQLRDHYIGGRWDPCDFDEDAGRER